MAICQETGILVQGKKTNEKIAGSSPVVLILHGWGSSSEAWLKVAEFLTQSGYKIIVPDLPGFGKNLSPESPWGIGEYVEWLNEFVKKNNLSRFFLLGHSFGGSLAVKFVLKYPQKIEKLFLVASSGIRKKTIKKKLFKRTAGLLKIFSFLPFYPLAKKAFYKIIIKKSDYPLAKGVMKETYLKVISEDISNYFNRISIPTIIIWGDKDDTVPVSNAYFINREIKDSKLIIIPGANHDLERKVPEILAEKIMNNLQ